MAISHIPFVDAESVEALLPMPQLIAAAGAAFRRPPTAPPRLVLNGGGPDWLTMPCLDESGSLVCKLVRADMREQRPADLPTISGVIVVLSPEGRLEALVDAAAVTSRRTAAIAAFATDVLARPDASVLALFGTGALAADHVEAIDVVRPLRSIRVVGRSPQRSRAFVQRLRDRGWDATLETPEAALAGADLVTTVTTATTPVFAHGSIQPGTHINAMGSYRPTRREIPGETVARARVVVEVREHAWHEAGDLVQALDAGLIDRDHIAAELSDHSVLAGLRAENPQGITLFKSVGHAALDMAAIELLRRGRALPAATDAGAHD